MKLESLLSNQIVIIEGIKVGQAALNRAIASADDNLQMGFEVEFVPIEVGTSTNIPLTKLKYHQLDDFFSNTEVNTEAYSNYIHENEEEFIDRDELEEEYWDDWARSNKKWYEEYIDNNGYEDDPKDEWPDKEDAKAEIKEDDLRDKIEEYINEHLWEVEISTVIEHWLEQDPMGLIDEMEWEMEPGYDIENGEIVEYNDGNEELASEIGDMFGDPAQGLAGYHDEEKELDTWYVEPDTSVDNGLEISSPVKPVSQSLKDLEKIFDWMTSKGHRTNQSTGLHVSLSFTDDENPENVDWVKLAVLMGEEHILEAFKRLGNIYTHSQLDRIRKSIHGGNIDNFNNWEGYQKVKSEISKGIFGSKDSSFNISNFEDTGRIEFRIMGNKDYHRDFKKVKNGVGRYVMFLNIANDENSYKKEYMTKLGKLLTGTKNDPLKSTQDHMKNEEGQTKKWIRAFASAFGHLSQEAVTTIRDIIQMAHVAKEHPQETQSQRRLGHYFFNLFSYHLSRPATQIFNQEVQSLVAESIGFIEYLIEKKTSKLDRMKKVSQLFAKEMNVDKEEFGHRFHHYPDNFVGEIKPEYGKVPDEAMIALLLYPETQDTLDEVLQTSRKVMRVANKIKLENTKKLFLEMMKYLSTGRLQNPEHIEGGLRNVIYFIQDDPIKNNKDMQQFLRTMIQKAESKNLKPMRAIISNTAKLDNQEMAIKYAHNLMGRHLPKELQPVPKEVKQHQDRQEQRQANYSQRQQQQGRRTDARQVRMQQHQNRNVRQQQVRLRQQERDLDNETRHPAP